MTRTPVLAVGSNASPDVLADKLITLLCGPPHTQVAVEVCEVSGLGVGHSAHISRQGYVAAAPYCLPRGDDDGPRLPAPRAYSVGWFTPEQLVALDATEPNYDRITLPAHVRVTPRHGRDILPGVMVYRSCHGVIGDRGRPLALRSQDQIHGWLAQRLPLLSVHPNPASYADPQVRERVKLELIRRGLVVPSGLTR